MKAFGLDQAEAFDLVMYDRAKPGVEHGECLFVCHGKDWEGRVPVSTSTTLVHSRARSSTIIYRTCRFHIGPDKWMVVG